MSTVMISRSEIRRYALQLLYSLEEQHIDFSSLDTKSFWNIALEKENERFIIAQAKAAEHVTRNMGDHDRLLHQRAETALELMGSYIETVSCREAIERTLKAVLNFEAARSALHFSLLHKARRGFQELSESIANTFRTAATDAALTATLLPTFDDHPAFAQTLDPLKAILNRRLKVTTLLAKLQAPLAQPLGNEYTGLVQQAASIAEIPSAAETLVQSVLSKKEEIAAVLEKTVENYIPTRMDLIDRCILHIALYELLYSELPAAIVVSESTALADLFSGVKSARFVHGIIGAAAQAHSAS